MLGALPPGRPHWEGSPFRNCLGNIPVVWEAAQVMESVVGMDHPPAWVSRPPSLNCQASESATLEGVNTKHTRLEAVSLPGEPGKQCLLCCHTISCSKSSTYIILIHQVVHRAICAVQGWGLLCVGEMEYLRPIFLRLFKKGGSSHETKSKNLVEESQWWGQ